MYTRVAVEGTKYHFDKPFTYEIPKELENKLKPGMRVEVPFGAGNKSRVAVVLSIEPEAAGRTKQICALLDEAPLLLEEQLALTQWMQRHYFCTLFEAAKLMIPIGARFHIQVRYGLNPSFQDFDRRAYTDVQWHVIQLLYASVRQQPFSVIAEQLGIREDHAEFRALLEKGIVLKETECAGQINDASQKMVRAVCDYNGKLTKLQQSAYDTLCEVGTVSEKELMYYSGVSRAVVQAVVKKGAAELFDAEIYRRPAQAYHTTKAGALTLSPEQEEIYQGLLKTYHQEQGAAALLYGVTGSGKTSVFLRLIEAVLANGEDSIVMVPEISLTAQTVALFTGYFGDKVALFHSGLSVGERYDEWKRVDRGEAKIVIGTRSAVFAPVKRLGLIVIDEEQEQSYKSESAPRYDAREIARWRCAKHQALCLLSSATPSLESAYLAQRKMYSFFMLKERFGAAQLPEVEIVDMGEDEKGHPGVVGSRLKDAMESNLAQGHQSILLVNRRGYHTFASCTNCKTVQCCPHCSISLTYHSANNRMMCHYCGYSIPFTTTCSECGCETITFRGSGTQKAEEDVARLFPEARILRLDTDSVSGKYSLEKKLAAFAEGSFDIMVGTQMVAKGLNFENVTLVGVVSADQMLFSDDFRSNERAFDLLTQVVGRAGRGRYKGRAIIQTYVPENEYIALAAKQDYFGFFKREMHYRKAMLYPPYADIVVLGFAGEQEDTVQAAAKSFLDNLTECAKAAYPDMPLRVLQASPAAVYKVSNRFRYKSLIKCRNTNELREMISKLLIDFAAVRAYANVTVYADVNPYQVL